MTNHPNARICDVEMEIAECLKHAPNKRGGLKYKVMLDSPHSCSIMLWCS